MEETIIVKSDLQKELEKEGWKLFINTGVYIFNSEAIKEHRDDELRDIYLSRNFKEVRIEKAYSPQGRELPHMRAVYVKDKY